MNYEKIDKAIAKITEEAMKLNNNFAIFIEEHLTEICTTEKVADKLLNESKKLEAFCKECKSNAEKKARVQGGGFQIAGLPDKEYFELVEEYYNITPEDKNQATGNVVDIMDLM